MHRFCLASHKKTSNSLYQNGLRIVPSLLACISERLSRPLVSRPKIQSKPVASPVTTAPASSSPNNTPNTAQAAQAAALQQPHRPTVTIIGNPATLSGYPEPRTRWLKPNSSVTTVVISIAFCGKCPVSTYAKKMASAYFQISPCAGLTSPGQLKSPLWKTAFLLRRLYSAPSAYFAPAVGRMAGVEVRKGSAALPADDRRRP